MKKKHDKDLIFKKSNNKIKKYDNELFTNNLLLYEENHRLKIGIEESSQLNSIRNEFTKNICVINNEINDKNEEMLKYCKRIAKLMHVLSKNCVVFQKKINMLISGEWLTYLILQKQIYDKSIIIYPDKKCSRYALQQFICFLKNIDYVIECNKIYNSYNEDYISVVFKIDNICKNVLFYYTCPFTHAQLNMLTYSLSSGINTSREYYTESFSILDSIFYKHVVFNQDTKISLKQMDYSTKKDFGNKLIEINNFIKNDIKISAFCPKFYYNKHCCIENENVIGPLIEFECKHYMCINDVREYITYLGESYKKCPICRKDINIEFIHYNLIDKHVNDEDNNIQNDDINTYFLTINEQLGENESHDENTTEHDTSEESTGDSSYQSSENSQN